MFIIILVIIGTLFLARSISGYDNRYNDRKYFIVKNKDVAGFLLPKTTSWTRSTVKRSKSNFCKMTYIGAIFYICNLLLILSIPIFTFLVPKIKIQPFEINSRYIYIIVDSLNEKIPVLLSFILMANEIEEILATQS